MKKIVSFVVVTLLAVAMAVSAVACTKKKAAVTLVGFPATFTEETQEAGDFYTLRREVRDTNDNTYPLTAEVKTSAGGGVSVIGGEFELTDIGGYVVTYTAHISDSDIRTSVVTIPVADNVAPTVSIPTPPSGFVGELYTLPTINFADNIGVTATSVEVYLLDDKDADNVKDENKQKRTQQGDTYTFTPTERGYYRIVASATDGSGHTTTRTADFAVDEIYPENIIFAPEALDARKQLSARHNGSAGDANVTSFDFVSADDNKDEVYGGAYWNMPITGTEWVNHYIVPVHDTSVYADYDVITAWIYVDSTVSVAEKLYMLNEETEQKPIQTNKWTLVEIDKDKFISNISKEVFYAVKCTPANGIKGTRLGEVAARKRTAKYFTISEIGEVTIPDGGAATVTFTVTPPEGVDEYTVKVTDGSGSVIPTSPTETNSYSCQISTVGEYTVTVTTDDKVYLGPATETFVAKDDSRIELDGGKYPATIDVGEELDILDVKVYKAGAEQPGVEPTVKVYKKSGEDWVDDSENLQGKKYTPQEKGEIKVEYSAELVANKLSCEIKVGPYVFCPTADTGEKIHVNSGASFNANEKTFVAADGERQEEYKGAYWQLPTKGTAGWNNIGFDFEHETDYYKKYDFITMWLKIEASQAPSNLGYQVSFGGAYWHRRSLPANVWTKITLVKPRDHMTGNVADSVFFSNFKAGDEATAENFNFNQVIPIHTEAATTALLIGEITGGMKADITETETTFFDPTASDIGTAVGTSGGNITTSGVENPDSSDYSGSCISWKPDTSSWPKLYLRPTDGKTWTDLVNGAEIKIWIYVSGSGEYEMVMGNRPEARIKIMRGKWAQLTLSLGQYLSAANNNNSGNPYFLAQNPWPADTTVYIGEGTIVTYEDRAD